MFERITIEQYTELAEDFDAQKTIFVGGRWPISIGVHRDLGHVVLAHMGDQAIVGTMPRDAGLCGSAGSDL